MVAHELSRRFGEAVKVAYLDVSNHKVLEEHSETVNSIETQGLLYPVTLIDGVPRIEGGVSYPSIMKIVSEKIATIRH